MQLEWLSGGKEAMDGQGMDARPQCHAQLQGTSVLSQEKPAPLWGTQPPSAVRTRPSQSERACRARPRRLPSV